MLYVCVAQYLNPDAPAVILVGYQERIAEGAKRFMSQSEAIPVFIRQSKQRRSEFVVERYSDNREEIIRFARRAYRADVSGILFMRRVNG